MLYSLWVIKMNTENITIAERLKLSRKKANYTLEQIGTIVGVHKSTVLRWEKGETERIGLPTIQTLASYYNVNPAWLMGADVPMEREPRPLPDNILPLPQTKLVPLVGTIACGTPILAEENIEDYVKIDEKIPADFALRCKGDSMINSRIFDGDIVYIRKQSDVDDGEIAAVLIGEEATLKKVYKYPNKIVLRASNPLYDDMVYTDEELESIIILGKAVAFFSLVR